MVFLACKAAAYFGLPAALRYLAQNQTAAALRLWVIFGDLKLDPCDLRLVIGTLRAAGQYGSRHFNDISRIDLRLSWTSPPHLSRVVEAAQTIRRHG